jgi:rhomboid protease GluP
MHDDHRDAGGPEQDPDATPDLDYEPGPEEFGEVPERPRGPLAIFPSPVHAIPAVLLFALFYAATAVYTGYPQGEYLWISGDSIFREHEYWRLITAMFTHANLSHLLSNALIFLIFGWMLKAYFGLALFPAASICIGLITNAVTVAFYDPAIRLLGASGMAYGMVSLWLVFYIHNDTYHAMPVRIFRAIGFALVMMFPTTFEPQVSYLSHAVGFLAGLAAGFALVRFIPVRDPS